MEEVLSCAPSITLALTASVGWRNSFTSFLPPSPCTGKEILKALCTHVRCQPTGRQGEQGKAGHASPPPPAERLQHRGRRTAPRAPGQHVGPLSPRGTGAPRATRYPLWHSGRDTSGEADNGNLVGLEIGCFRPLSPHTEAKKNKGCT